MSRKERSFSGRSDTSGESEATLDLYEATARYYDLQYTDFPQDVDFYTDLAEVTEGPVLECMCGTGRILIPLAMAGFEVLGVDRSPAMLDECTRKIDLCDPVVQARVEIIQDDVRKFKTERRFKLTIVPFNSFLHLLETRDQESALRNLHEHMEEDGLLVIGIFNPDLSRPEGIMRHKETILTDEGEVVSRFDTQIFDRPAQKTTIHYFFDISRQDKPMRRVTAKFTLRYLFHREMMELLQRTGFDVLDVYGDYELSPFTKKSDLMVFLARRS
ncbi:MAG TPA: class I SAM-dependent methyltransferase [Methanomassiliicoccales archaeon]|nr:class I SAM-dependent methyltransferase [Methanomassiliicoccales archaeon]